MLTRQVLAPDAGSFNFSFGGPLESYPLGELDPLFHPSSCRAWIGGSLRQGAYDFEEVAISCASTDGRLFLAITHIPDPRKLELGSFVGSSGDSANTYTDQCLVDESCDYRCSLCRFEAPEGSVTVTVTKAVGGPAPLPEFVTADFEREFVVEYAFPGPVQGPRDSCPQLGPCLGTVFIEGSVRITIRAADYVVDMDAPCPC